MNPRDEPLANVSLGFNSRRYTVETGPTPGPKPGNKTGTPRTEVPGTTPTPNPEAHHGGLVEKTRANATSSRAHMVWRCRLIPAWVSPRCPRLVSAINRS